LAQDDEQILDTLQERMERIIRGDAPNAGRFCGYCYARLDRGLDTCPVCGRRTDETGEVRRVPREALRVYNAYRRKMQLWVNLFAFLGIFLAIVLTGVMIAFLPAPWNFIAAVTVLFTAWYFANLLGGGLGAAIGSRQGRTARAARWRQLLQRRVSGENLDGEPEP
jgi:predicted amidophosphoribosyltransferase